MRRDVTMRHWTQFYYYLGTALCLVLAAYLNTITNEDGIQPYQMHAIILTCIICIFVLIVIYFYNTHTFFDGRNNVRFEDLGPYLADKKRIWLFSEKGGLLYHIVKDNDKDVILVQAWPSRESAQLHQDVFPNPLTSISTSIFLQRIFALMCIYKEDIYVSLYYSKDKTNIISFNIQELFSKKHSMVLTFGIFVTIGFYKFVGKLHNIPTKNVPIYLGQLRGERSASEEF